MRVAGDCWNASHGRLRMQQRGEDLHVAHYTLENISVLASPRKLPLVMVIPWLHEEICCLKLENSRCFFSGPVLQSFNCHKPPLTERARRAAKTIRHAHSNRTHPPFGFVLKRGPANRCCSAGSKRSSILTCPSHGDWKNLRRVENVT